MYRSPETKGGSCQVVPLALYWMMTESPAGPEPVASAVALTPPVADVGYQSEVMLAPVSVSVSVRAQRYRVSGERVREVDAIGAVAEVGDDLRARVVAVVRRRCQDLHALVGAERRERELHGDGVDDAGGGEPRDRRGLRARVLGGRLGGRQVLHAVAVRRHVRPARSVRPLLAPVLGSGQVPGFAYSLL